MNKKSEKRNRPGEINLPGLSSQNQQMIRGGASSPLPLTFSTPTWKYISSTNLMSIAAAGDGYIDGAHVGVGYEVEKI